VAGKSPATSAGFMTDKTMLPGGPVIWD
jgi:hypothetical protein